jgi:hypothetical protein
VLDAQRRDAHRARQAKRSIKARGEVLGDDGGVPPLRRRRPRRWRWRVATDEER